jgi:citrate synthase
MPLTDYVSSAEALKILKVRLQTLYAYVSRGYIRSIQQPGHRGHLYSLDDLKRMAARSAARSGHGPVAASAMDCGEPIVPTSITELTPQGPCYRGHLAIDLARRQVPFESVSQLLWTGIMDDDAESAWPVSGTIAELEKFIRPFSGQRQHNQILEIFTLATVYLGMRRGSISERVLGGQTLEAGRQLIQALVSCIGLESARTRYCPIRDGMSIAEGLMNSLSLEPNEVNSRALEAILTLLADHELAPGTLSARVAASSGATLHSCIASAICTSSGVKIGKLFDSVNRFLDGADNKSGLLSRAIEYQQRGIEVPGFTHPLYPHGDPRAKLMFELARQRREQTRELAAMYSFTEEMEQQHGLHPRHEFGLIALTRAMGLNKQIPGALFIIARVAGWLAHVNEQRLTGVLLRPRALYVGSGSLAAAG